MTDAQRTIWGQAFASLTAIAKGWTRNAADSEDLAQTALTEAWTEAPDETDVAALVRRAAWIMKGNLANQRRAAKRRGSERWLGAAAETTRGLRRTPEQLAATRERKERLFERLREELAGDADALALVDETLQDRTTPAEQVEALGWEIGRVRNARKRLSRALEIVQEEEDAAPESARGWEQDGDASDAGDARDEGGSEAES